MMMIRALPSVTQRAVRTINTSATANLVFEQTESNSRIWVPNQASQTALNNSGDPITLLSAASFVSWTANGIDEVATNAPFYNAALPHFYFDGENNLRLDNSWNRGALILNPSAITITTLVAMGVDANSIAARYYPADRCVWQQDYDGTSYVVHSAQFYPGDTSAVDLHNASLGYIGKSGRFVEIAN